MFIAGPLLMLDTDPPGLNVFTMERMMKLPSTAHLARVCARHPWKVIGAWVVVVALALIAARGLDDALTTSADFSGKPEYQVGADLLQQRLRGDRPLTETVVVHSDSMRYDDSSFQSTVEQATTALTGMQEVTEVSNVYLAQAAQAPGASSLVSADGHSALITVTFASDLDDTEATTDTYLGIIAAQGSDDIRVYSVGDLSVERAGSELAKSDLSKAESISLPLSILILALIFCALLAVGLPVVLSVV
jgi:RND superfamily putative drug exporter